MLRVLFGGGRVRMGDLSSTDCICMALPGRIPATRGAFIRAGLVPISEILFCSPLLWWGLAGFCCNLMPPVVVKDEVVDGEGSYACVVCFESCRGAAGVLHCPRCVAASRVHSACTLDGKCPVCAGGLVLWENRAVNAGAEVVEVESLPPPSVARSVGELCEVLNDSAGQSYRLALLEAERSQWMSDRAALLHDRTFLLNLLSDSWVHYLSEVRCLMSVDTYPTGLVPEVDGTRRAVCAVCKVEMCAPAPTYMYAGGEVVRGICGWAVPKRPELSRLCSKCMVGPVASAYTIDGVPHVD